MSGRHEHAELRTPALPDAVDVYDTTLRDGSQQEGLSLTVDDKLRVAEQLDHLGVQYIEGGWPGANPKDEEFFHRAPAELDLSVATLVAFGSTRRAGARADEDEVLRHLVKANTPAVCIVGKAWDHHVTEALRTDLEEGVRMVGDSVDCLVRLTPVAHHIAELVNINPHPQQPYVGTSSFAHKAGLHTSAIARSRDAYEHINPDLVGNGTRFVVSELAGKSTLVLKAEELGLELESAALSSVLETLKRLEHQGYHFEVADGSLELLMRGSGGWTQGFFRLESFRILTEQREDGRFVTEATIKLWVGDERVVATAEGNGPVNALDGALRKAIGGQYPELGKLHLTDYRVRVLDTTKGTAAVTRVLLDTTDGERSWSTIGVSENIIEASWQALSDSIVYGLLHNTGPRDDPSASGPGGP